MRGGLLINSLTGELRPSEFIKMKDDKKMKSVGVQDAEAGAKGPKVFAKLTNDKVFKIVLGTEGKSENLLKSLLNEVLNMNVVDLRFIPTEKVGRTDEEGKSVFDVYCEDVAGRRFLIEMQMWYQKYFSHRAAYYMSLGINDQAQLEKKRQEDDGKKWNYYFPPIYEVNFLNYKNNLVCPVDGGSDSYPFTAHYDYKNEYGMRLGDGSNIYFVDLERFRKSFEECDNDLEKWLFSIKNMHMLEERPTGVDGTNLEELYNEAKLAAWPPQKRSNYERIMGHENDYQICLQDMKEIGREEGRAEGEARGEARGKRETAKKLLVKGMSISDIAEVTGLTVEEIEGLK